MGEPERDAIDIYFLLYPMLTEGQKQTSEGRKAYQLAQKYRDFSRDSDNLAAYAKIVHIIQEQLLAERPLLQKRNTEADILTNRLDAYHSIVRMLTMGHAFKEPYLGWTGHPMQELPPEPVPSKAKARPPKTKAGKTAKAPSAAKKPVRKPGAKKSATKPRIAKTSKG